MKKKQLFALLGAVIIAISSAACGNSGNSSDTGTAESQEDAGAGNTSGAVDAEAAEQAFLGCLFPGSLISLPMGYII